MTTTPADVEILRGVLDPWKAAIDAHDPEGIAELFTEDAVFQGLHPYTVGRQGVADYYASQPLGLTAEYRILETRRPATDFVYGYLSVDFGFADGRPTVPVLIGVAAQRSGDDWTLALYQVSHRPASISPPPIIAPAIMELWDGGDQNAAARLGVVGT